MVLPQESIILSIAPRTYVATCLSLSADFQNLIDKAESFVLENLKLRGVASQLEDLRFGFQIWKSDIGIDSNSLSQNDELTNSTLYRVIITSFVRMECQLALVRSAIIIIVTEEKEKASLSRFSMIKLVRLNLSSTKAFNTIRHSCDIIKSVLRNLADLVYSWQMLCAIHNNSGPFVKFRNHVSTVKRRVEDEQNQRLLERLPSHERQQ